MTDKKVIVIGLDGATWDLIKPWVEKGILPTFKKLMENGVYGNLESTIPPLTGPAWVSFATGRNPGKHGCYDFFIPRKSLNDMKPITAEDIHGKTFYEILNENGKKCILINLPVSYPPRIKEIVITGLLTQGDDFIFPPDLVDEIPELKDYRIIPKISRKDTNAMDYVNDNRELEKNKFECAKKLFDKEWDFFFLMFSGTDAIQHVLYDKLVSGTMNDDSDPIKFYKEIDEYIEWFLNDTPKNVNILFMSDHGFSVYKKIVFINTWLRNEGYLTVEPRLKPSSKIQITAERDKKVKANRINIKLPHFLVGYLKFFTWMYPLYMKLKKILPLELHTGVQPKLSETIAYSTMGAANFGEIYINDKKRFIDGKVETCDYESIRTEIINKLKQLKDTKTGENVLKNIWKKEEIYSGERIDIAPDIIFMLVDDYISSPSLLITKLFDDNLADERNTHELKGIFLAYGHDIEKGGEIEGAKIHDLAPTILHIFGTPIPKDMDGKVLKEIFKEHSELAKKEVAYQEVSEMELVRERISKSKALGKI